MVNIQIRLITLFVAKDGEALYGQQKECFKLISCIIFIEEEEYFKIITFPKSKHTETMF